MKFTFELYRAASKSKDVPKSQKLILNSNDRMHPIQKNNFVDKLKQLAVNSVLKNVDVEIVQYSKTVKRKGELVKVVAYKLANPCFNKQKNCGATLTVYTPTNRKSDPDNLQPTMKALMDGFTESGLWIDDNHNVVKFTKYQFGGLSGTKAYRLEVDVEEIN